MYKPHFSANNSRLNSPGKTTAMNKYKRTLIKVKSEKHSIDSHGNINMTIDSYISTKCSHREQLHSLYEVCSSEIENLEKMKSKLASDINTKLSQLNKVTKKILKNQIKLNENKENDSHLLNRRFIFQEVINNKSEMISRKESKHSLQFSNAINSDTAYKFREFFKRRFGVSEKTDNENKLNIDRPVPVINVNNSKGVLNDIRKTKKLMYLPKIKRKEC